MILVRAAKKFARNAIRLSLRWLQRGPHMTRYYMYRRLSQLRSSGEPNAKVLSLSDSRSLCKLLGFTDSQIIEANYPEYNVLSLPFSNNDFDYVISDQVLEHVEGNPQSAVDETFRVLKPGGFAVHTTCFINPVHRAPGDFWRFTPEALALMCGRWSKIIEVGGWGNPYVWLVGWIDEDLLRSEGIPEASWHPLHKLAMLNDAEWPIVTWVIAQK